MRNDVKLKKNKHLFFHLDNNNSILKEERQAIGYNNCQL